MLQSNNSDSNTIKYINLQNGIEIEEISTYPLNNIIIYKERKNNKTIRSFTYIIEEGVYPSHNILVTTGSPNKKLAKKIPDNYIAITTWGRGPLVFGLQLETLNKIRKTEKRLHTIKPAIQCSDKTLMNRARKMGTLLQSSFNNEARSKYYIEDKVNLKSVDFSVDKYNYHIDFNPIQENQKIQSLVQTIDQNKISRDSYRNLTIDEPNLPREWALFTSSETPHSTPRILCLLLVLNSEASELVEFMAPKPEKIKL
ncbi:5384_t:CDS:2, partial [Dentiscutata erythropus]